MTKAGEISEEKDIQKEVVFKREENSFKLLSQQSWTERQRDTNKQER